MTKKVRIENADMATFPVTIEVWQKCTRIIDEKVFIDPDTLVKTVTLNNPTDMNEFYIHSHQYLVVKEV